MPFCFFFVFFYRRFSVVIIKESQVRTTFLGLTMFKDINQRNTFD